MKNGNSVNQPILADKEPYFEYLKNSLNHKCSEITKRFNFRFLKGESCTAAHTNRVVRFSRNNEKRNVENLEILGLIEPSEVFGLTMRVREWFRMAAYEQSGFDRSINIRLCRKT